MRILVVEDEGRLAQNIAAFLRKPGGYAVDVSTDGEDGRYMALNNPYDLIILDLMLPKVDGWTILKDLRAEGIKTAVLVLTARDATEDIVRGLEEGGDDYLTKPFEMAELAARCKALIRRCYDRADSVLAVGPLEINTASHKVTVQGQPVSLRAMEYKLLEYLAMRSGHVVSQADITEHLYDFESEKFSNVVEVYISSLRRKLDPKGERKLIQTIRGAGYILGGSHE
ncbi:MAG: response regulator transcription factor [Planctomycetota bacterium]